LGRSERILSLASEEGRAEGTGNMSEVPVCKKNWWCAYHRNLSAVNKNIVE